MDSEAKDLAPALLPVDPGTWCLSSADLLIYAEEREVPI